MEFVILSHNFTNDLRTISYTIILSKDIYLSEQEFLNKYFLEKIFLCRTLENDKVFSGRWEIKEMDSKRVNLEYFSKGSILFGYEANNFIFLENLKELINNKETKLSAEKIFNNVKNNLQIFL